MKKTATKKTTEDEKAIVPIKQRVEKMTTVVNELKISDQKSLDISITVLSGIKSVAKEITAKKKEITDPLNQSLRAARALFAPMEDAYKKAEMSVKGKMVVYNREVEEARKKAEEKEAAKVDRGSIKLETAAKHLEEVPEAKSHINSEGGGSVTIKKVKTFKVVDLNKIPIEYLKADEVKIRIAMRNGVELPGVEYGEEDSVSAR